MVPSLNHFDYNSGTNINGGTTSTTSSSATAAAASSSSSYPYIGCTGNYPTSYSPFATLTSLPQPSSLSSQHQQQQQNHQTSTLISAAVASTAAASSNENDDNNNGGISSSSYQTNSETYLTNLCNNNRMNGDNNNLGDHQHHNEQSSICARDGCQRTTIDSNQWDREFCSEECCVRYCSDVFRNWTTRKQQQMSTDMSQHVLTSSASSA